MSDSIILGIESSCDDTSAAIIKGNCILSNIAANQEIHKEYGGVVPELASRAHQQNIIPVVEKSIIKANIQQNAISAIGFTRGPGLFVLNCILFIAAVLNMLIAKFGAAIIMAILPIMIGFIFFDAVRQWAMNWFSKMLNFSLIYILSIAVVRFGYSVFGDAIKEVAATATVTDAALITAQQWGQLVIVEGVMIICMLQVRGWAAALSSGATVGGSSLVLMALRSIGVRR